MNSNKFVGLLTTQPKAAGMQLMESIKAVGNEGMPTLKKAVMNLRLAQWEFPVHFLKYPGHRIRKLYEILSAFRS